MNETLWLLFSFVIYDKVQTCLNNLLRKCACSPGSSNQWLLFDPMFLIPASKAGLMFFSFSCCLVVRNRGSHVLVPDRSNGMEFYLWRFPFLLGWDRMSPSVMSAKAVSVLVSFKYRGLTHSHTQTATKAEAHIHQQPQSLVCSENKTLLLPN